MSQPQHLVLVDEVETEASIRMRNMAFPNDKTETSRHSAGFHNSNHKRANRYLGYVVELSERMKEVIGANEYTQRRLTCHNGWGSKVHTLSPVTKLGVHATQRSLARLRALHRPFPLSLTDRLSSQSRPTSVSTAHSRPVMISLLKIRTDQTS